MDSIMNITAAAIVTMSAQLVLPIVPDNILATHEISLEERYYPVQKENILLNLAYLDGKVKSKQDINWDEIQKPFTIAFKLNPGEVFAYHDDILSEYTGKIAKTTNSHFNFEQGFKSAGYLVGDGVCHLASLMYWVALDAGLEAKAPTNHDFMTIPGIAREHGVSIFNNPTALGSNSMQNLYITNNKDKPVTFKFEYDGTKLKASAVEAI